MGTNKTYYHPHVSVNTTVKKRTRNISEPVDTTVLFTPLVTEKGPTGKLVKAHNLSEFIENFGSLDENKEEFFKLNGLMAFNVYNWLSNGGTLYTYRLSGDATKTTAIAQPLIGEMTKITPIPTGYSEYAGKTEFDADTKYIEYPSAILVEKNSDGYSLKAPVIIHVYKTVETNVVEDIDAQKLITELKLSEGTENKLQIKDGNTLIAELPITIELDITAKYAGDYYNEFGIRLVHEEEGDVYSAEVYRIKDGSEIVEEKYRNTTAEMLYQSLRSSQFVIVSKADFNKVIEKLKTFNATGENVCNIRLGGAAKISNSYSETVTLLGKFYDKDKNEWKTALKNRLESPVDIILDAAYPADLKIEIGNFCSANGGVRDDIICLLDLVEMETDNFNAEDYLTMVDTKADDILNLPTATNVSLYKQYFTITDSTFTGQDIKVGTSYFLSKLIPYNDEVYGPQFACAGLRRAILEDAIDISENPDSETKEAWFKARYNYTEKTSREYAIMSQRTHDGSTTTKYTALSFLNNSRCLEKMKKEVERKARTYLQELNDATTLSNLETDLNKYINTWLANRTLSLATVSVEAETDTSVVITLTVRFTGTIEVISVNIIVE